VNQALKRRIINGLELLPYGHDLYLQLARKRLGITYRGIYDSFEQAQGAAESRLPNRYDVINENKGEHLDQELSIVDKRVLDIDYPLLFWLSRLMEPNQKVWELGGSLGQSFYSFERYFPYPDNIEWVIAELPGAVQAGRRIAARRGEHRLKFRESGDTSAAPRSDLFLTAGTLQYMEIDVGDVLEGLEGLPTHVLIHNLPVHNTDEFWTLQYLDVCEVPYHISSRTSLVENLTRLGYELVDQWKNPRQIEIPYRPEKKVDGYCGFYFRNTHGEGQNGNARILDARKKRA